MSIAMEEDTPAQAIEAGSLAVPRRRRKALPLHRCRFPDFSPTAISALAITPTTFDTATLAFGGVSAQRGLLAVGRANGDVELMCWGGHQGWISWRTLPSSFPLSKLRNSKKPSSLLSHLLFTHQTTLSPSDLALYDGDLDGAKLEIARYEKEGVRLFGVGGVASELVEWEWGGPGATKEVGRVKSTLPTLPPIFALAVSRASSQLAIGCEDSTIRILNILDDELELISKIEVGGPGKVRALSLAWGPPVSASFSKGKAREDSPDESSLPAHFATPADTYLIAGCSNSSLRRFDAPPAGSSSGIWRGIHRMTVDRLKGEQTVVWACAVLGDGTVVSGDSMGNIKFFDGEMGTQLQSFKTHKADVLCLTIGSDGTSVFTSGVDQKTSEFRLVSVNNSRVKDVGASARWVQSSGRRLHSHDVRAMLASPPYSQPLPDALPSLPPTPQVPILTSGGLDLGLVIVSASSSSRTTKHPLPNPVSDTVSTEFETTIHRRCSFVPQRSRPFTISAEARLLVCRRERSIGIWQLENPSKTSSNGDSRNGWSKNSDKFGASMEVEDDEEEEEDVESTPGWTKVVEMELKLQTNLIASAVSNDGKWLAVSDLYETKLFRLQIKNGELSPRRQKTFSTSLSAALPTSLGTGSSSLIFSSDSQRLILATSFGSSIAVVDLTSGQDEFSVVKVFSDHADRVGTREIRGRPGHTNGRSNGQTNGDLSMNGADSDSDDETTGPTEYSRADDKPATVVCLAVSNDGKWLGSADLERNVCVFNLETLKHHTTLPTPSHVPTSLVFTPSSTEPTLLIALPTNAISLFNLTTLRFQPWSHSLSSLEVNTLMDIREPILGVVFEPRSESTWTKESRKSSLPAGEIAVIWGANWVAKINLEDLKNDTKILNKTISLRREADKKRARDSESIGVELKINQLEIKITRRYQPLMMFGFVGMGELLAVEKTWFDLAKSLPEAWIRSGTFGS